MLTLFYLTCLLIFWLVQIRTVIFVRHYFTQILFLLWVGIIGLMTVVVGFDLPVSSPGWRLFLVIVFATAVLHLGLAFVKLVLTPGARARALKHHERAQSKFNAPTRRPILHTEDGVRIQAVHLVNEQPRETVVIVCHGAGRNKDIYVNVTTCELLFEDYDVITFDFRGHGESAGKWSGDKQSTADLRAVLSFARQAGYQKIAIVAWSFGAWVALMTLADGERVDTIVAAAPLPGAVREAALAKSLFSWGYSWWAFPLRLGMNFLRGFRIGRYDQHPSLANSISNIEGVSLLMVCNEYDRVIGVSREDFEALFEAASEPKELVVLNGSGHIYDWPNTFHYLTEMRGWLAEKLG